LCTASASRRARDALDLIEIGVGHRSHGVFAHGLKHVLHCDLLTTEIAGKDRAAIDENRGHVEPHHRHHHAGQGLVAARQSNQGVIAMAAHRQFDRIGDALTRWQGGLHTVVPHRDTVGDGDGAEFTWRASGSRDTLLDRLGLAHQRDVAGRSFIPAGCHADKGLMDLLRRQPHGI